MGKYEIVLSVCETGSISKTAQKLQYTQSAISQAIKSFEMELGFKIFYRSKQGMELKPNTDDIIKSLKIICNEQTRIKEFAANLNSLNFGNIRIGTIQSISYHWLPDILKDFSELYSNIRFELTVDGFQNLEKQLLLNELDCIFVSKYSVPNCPFIPMGRDELMLVTPKDHPLSEKLTVSLDDIQNQNFILSSDGLNYETGKIFELNNITPKIKYRLNEDFATIKMVEQGFGITILPKLLLKNTPFDVCVRSFTEHHSRTLGVAYSKNSEPMLITLKFLDFIKSWSGNHLIANH